MDWLWWSLLGADLVLVAVVVLLLWRLGRLGRLPQSASPAQLEAFLKEAQEISQEFDRLLAQKRQLVESTLGSLDARIAEIKQAAHKLQEELKAPAPPPEPEPAPRPQSDTADFRQKVAQLSRQGASLSQIVQATGRPRGEVELMLGLIKERS